MFTVAERRALDQLSTPGGRLGILAADQRTKLVAAREGRRASRSTASRSAHSSSISSSALAPDAPGHAARPRDRPAPRARARRASRREPASWCRSSEAVRSPLPTGCGRRSSCPMSERAACAGSAGRLRSSSFACAPTARTPDGANAARDPSGGRRLRRRQPAARRRGAGVPGRRRGRLDLRRSPRRPDPGGGAARRGMRRPLPQARVPGRRRRHARRSPTRSGCRGRCSRRASTTRRSSASSDRARRRGGRVHRRPLDLEGVGRHGRPRSGARSCTARPAAGCPSSSRWSP